MRIQIQGFKKQADPNPGQTLKSQKMNFDIKNKFKVDNRLKTYLRRYKSLLEREENGLFDILVNFHSPGSGSAFQQNQIQDSQVNADPDQQQ
jgi:hypothetical protein